MAETAQPEIIPRPELTFPEEVAAFVRSHYEAAETILEYGSGGSTALAADMPDKTVFSVESDLRWARRMKRWLRQEERPARVEIHHVDIGPTGKWGRPVDDSGWRNWHRYPLSVWDREDFTQPDLVLVDGRFRPACLVTTMLRTKRPLTVLFDDYTDRRGYHVVEKFVEPAEACGRMARFEIVPGAFPQDDLTLLVSLFNQPF